MNTPPDRTAKRKCKTEALDVGSVSDFVELVNSTVGKYFRCCICFSILEDPVMLPCNHPLCRGCATQCLRQNQRCPQCMADIPNLRTLQGRNKWITEMVDSLRNCLNEVGASLTQHAPVPAKYRNAPPPSLRVRARARDSGGARANRNRAPSPPTPARCGGASGAEVKREGGGSGSSSGNPNRKRPAPRRSSGGAAAAVPPLPPHGAGGGIASEFDVGGSTPPPRTPLGGWGNGDARRGRAQQPLGEEGEQARLPRGWALESDDDTPPPQPRLPFVIGDLVSVDSRTWPGMNKHGGVARICAVLDPPGAAYDVKYSVSRVFDRGVEARFVHPYAFPTETVGSRSRRSGSSGGSSSTRWQSGGSSGGSMSRRGGSASVHSPVASPRSPAAAAATAASSTAAAAAAAIADTATPTLLPSPPQDTTRYRQVAAGTAVVRSAEAVVAPESERNPGAAAVAERRGDDARPAGVEGRYAGGSSRSADTTAPPSAVHAGGGVCLSDAGTRISDGSEATSTPAGNGSAEISEVEGGLLGAMRTRQDEGDSGEGGAGGEAGGEGGARALASDGSGAKDEKGEDRRLCCGKASSPVCSVSAESSNRNGFDERQEHVEEEGEEQGGGEEKEEGEEKGGEEQGEEEDEKENKADLQLLPEPLATSPRCSVERPENMQHGTSRGQRERLPLSVAQTAGLEGASQAGAATDAPPPVEGKEVVEMDVEGDAAPLLEADDENNASEPLTMDVEDDATTPSQSFRTFSLSCLGSPPETGHDAPSASDLGSPSPVVVGSAAPGLPQGGLSERLDDGTRELDAEGTKPTGVPDGEPPADTAERELSVGVDERGDTRNRPPDLSPPAPSRPAPASLHVASEMPAGLAEEPERLPGQLVPLLPLPSRPSLAGRPTAPSPMPPPPPAPVSSLMPPPPPPPPSPKARTFKIGDWVSVPSRSSPGVNKEGGVAKITRLRPDGTYDLKYSVRLGAEKGVAGSILSFYALDDDDDDGDNDDGGGSRGGIGGSSSSSSSSGGRDSRERRDAATPPSSLSPVAASARVRRRTHRTNRGYCPPDAAAGQANAACLSYLLGETQHPELDLDPDLGEDLDPDEGSPGARGSQKRPGETKSAVTAAVVAATAAAGAGAGDGEEGATSAAGSMVEAGDGVCGGGGKGADEDQDADNGGEEGGDGGGEGGAGGEGERPSAGCEGVDEVNRKETSGADGTSGGRVASRGSAINAPDRPLSEGDTAVTPKTLVAPRDRGRGTNSARSRGRGRATPTSRKRARVSGDPASRAGVSTGSGMGGGESGDLNRASGSRGGNRGGRGGGGGEVGGVERAGEEVPESAGCGQSAEVVLIMSALTPKSTALADSLAKSHGWRVDSTYTDEVTHVVCGADPESHKANIRSAKYLRAVAGGKWVVNEAWLQECKKKKGRAEEEEFEIAGDRKSTVPSAPRRSRLAHAESGRPGLFQGIAFHFRGEFGMKSPPLSELTPMLVANGGTIAGTVDSLFSRPGGGERNAGSGGGGGGGAGGGNGSGSGCGSWRPRRVVIFQPSVTSPEEDARTLKKDLETLSRVGMPSGSDSGGGGRGGGSGGVGGGGTGAEDGDATVEVLKPLWLVDSVGSFRVLKPTVLHQVQNFRRNSNLRR